MLTDTQPNGETGFEFESKVETPHSAMETKRYVTDLLSELQMISSIGGLQSLSKDIEVLLSRHVPTPV